MSEQTASLCTTDAAESLRAVVAERDREIERLKEGQSILILARDEQKRLANEYRDLWSRAALKAQPSGLVPDSVDEAASILRNMIDSIGVHGNYSQESTLLFLNQALGCLDEVARLNSSPVSAGEPVYQFQCREIGEGDWGPCDHIRYMYCQKSPEMDTRVVQVLALSAPSQGEQVREVVPEPVRDALARRCLWLAFCWNDHNFGPAHEEARKEALKHGIDSFDVANEWLAAAPSAGSQEQA